MQTDSKAGPFALGTATVLAVWLLFDQPATIGLFGAYIALLGRVLLIKD